MMLQVFWIGLSRPNCIKIKLDIGIQRRRTLEDRIRRRHFLHAVGDHLGVVARVIDGADAIRFLRWVVDAIEQLTFLSVLG